MKNHRLIIFRSSYDTARKFWRGSVGLVSDIFLMISFRRDRKVDTCSTSLSAFSLFGHWVFSVLQSFSRGSVETSRNFRRFLYILSDVIGKSIPYQPLHKLQHEQREAASTTTKPLLVPGRVSPGDTLGLDRDLLVQLNKRVWFLSCFGP